MVTKALLVFASLTYFKNDIFLEGKRQAEEHSADIDMEVSVTEDRIRFPLHPAAIDLSKEISVNISISSKNNAGLEQNITSNLDRRKRYRRNLSGRVVITHHFIERTITTGGDVSMQCSATANRPPQFVWERDGLLVSSSTDPRYSLGQQMMSDSSVSASLNISRVRVEDGGFYACIAKEGEHTASYENRLNIYGPPYIRSLPPIKVQSGDSVSLRCPYYGYPVSKIEWEHQGKIITSNPYTRLKRSIQITDTNGILNIQEISKDYNNAIFTCIVTSPSGEMAKRAFEVLVIEAPVLDDLMMGNNLQEGLIANVYCNVLSGDQPIHFEWLKDGKRISSNLKIVERHSDLFSALVIKKVSLEHCGTYTCVASNHVAKVNRSTELYIKVAPKWREEPFNSSLLLGRRGVVSCAAVGYPIPQVHWMRKDGILGTWQPILDLSGGGILSLANGTLIIEEVSITDEGLYSCNVENGVGQPLSKTVWLSVNKPVYFETVSRNITVRLGHSVSIECNAMGDDPIRVTWLHRGTNLDPIQLRFKISEIKTAVGVTSTITFHHTEIEDAGDYQCRAGNPYGSAVYVVHLFILEPPTPPTDVRVESVESRKALVSWRDTLRAHIQYYTLQYTQGQYPIWDHATTVNVTRRDEEHRQSAELKNLRPASTYHVKVASGNQVDVSPYTVNVQFETMEEAPSTPPLNIQVEQSPTPGELTMSWYPPLSDTHNGILIGYRIRALPHNIITNDDGYTKTVKIIQPSGKQETTLNGLKKNTRYAVSIAAYTSAGTGPYSIPVFQDTREGAPELAPSSVECTAVSSTSLRIGWQPIAASGEGNSLVGYNVLYSTEDGVWQNATSLHTELYLQGMAKYTNYSIKVAGFSNYGTGPFSFPILCSTLEDVPGAPADIKVLVASLSSLLVSWKKPELPNGVLLSYNVYVKLTSSSSQPQIYRTDAKPQLTLSLEIPDLRQGRQYEIWVTGSTAAGEGLASRRVTHAPSNRVVAGVASLGGTLTVGVGSSLLLVCQCVGIPQPRTVWYHKQNIITHHPRFTRNHDDSLLINNIDQSLSGNYTCLAKNLYGADSVQYIVEVRAPPAPPNARAIPTAGGAEIVWEVGGPTTFNLAWKEATSSWQEAQTATKLSTQPGTQTHTVTNLKCGTKYSLRITATNKVGSSQPTFLDFSTLGGVPLPPTSTEWFWSNSTQIHISQAGWDYNGCPLTSWTVHYRPRHSGMWIQAYSDYDYPIPTTSNPWHRYPLDRLTSNLVIQNLVPATWYQIKVTVKNEAGSIASVFSYATRNEDGSEIGPSSDWFDINMIVIVCSSILLAGCLVSCVYILLRRHRMNELPDYRDSIAADNKSSSGNLTANTSHTNLAVKEIPNRIYSAPIRNTSKHELYEISPYAQFAVGFRTFGHVENQDLPSRHLRHKKYSSETSFQACSESEDSDSISKSTLKSVPRKSCRTPHNR